jgi:hypothetical protein
VFSTSTGRPVYWRSLASCGLDPAARAAGLATETHNATLALVDADGRPVEVPQAPGGTPGAVRIEHTFCTGIPPLVRPGTPLDWAFAFAIGVPLEPGNRYQWRMTIDGREDEDWCVAFETYPKGPEALAA